MHQIENVLITCGSGMLGQHLAKHLQMFMPNLKSIRILDEIKFEKQLDFETKIPIEYFEGNVFDDKVLVDALLGVQAVFHLYEYKDYSMFPDVDKFDHVNAKGTQCILDACAAVGSVKYFIYGSSVDVMISRKLHSVNLPETARLPKYADLAFPEYARSKLEAEQLVMSIPYFQTFVVRLGPMFGELDKDSWIVARLKQANKANGVLLVVGDQENVMQHTYVGNVAYGLVRVLQKMIKGSEATKEVTFIVDDFPLLNMYENIKPFLNARKYTVSEHGPPFYPLFWGYRFMEMALKFANNVFDVESRLRSLPSSGYLFTYFYNWNFFKSLKCRVYIDYKPLYTFEQAVAASLPYYSKMDL